MDHGTHFYDVKKYDFPFGLQKLSLNKVLKDFKN